MEFFLIFFAGFLLDLLFGDPYWMPHPVIFIGKLISKFETFLRKKATDDASLRRSGVALVFLVLASTFVVFGGCIFLLDYFLPLVGVCAKILLTYQVLATKCLISESKKVHKTLVHGTLVDARKQVGYLVGRDTGALSEVGVTKATIETIAENTVDGVVAPLFYMAIGGPVLGILYKAVNTMDSMVGYKNDKYLHFGRAAAKFDDICNFIPARITAFFMIAAAFLCKFSAKGAFQIWKRDRKNHASPNSAQTESVCAGALGIQLAGDAIYFGKVVKKPFIGDNTREIIPYDIKRAYTLMLVTALVALLVFGGILIIVR